MRTSRGWPRVVTSKRETAAPTRTFEVLKGVEEVIAGVQEEGESVGKVARAESRGMGGVTRYD